MRKRIGIIGADQSIHVKRILDDDFEVVEGPDLNCNRAKKLIELIQFYKNVDIVYRIYAPTETPFMSLAKMMQTPVILHWIGTDVMNALNNPNKYRKIASYASVNITCYEELQNELASIGIKADVVPIVPVAMDLDLSKMPNEHCVLVYMPNGREDLYGIDTLLEVAKALPGLNFRIVANDSKIFDEYANIQALGKLTLNQMEDLYNQISIVLRNTKHDGLSMSVIEGLAKGKYVIWNHALEGIIYANNPKDIISALQKITATSPTLNIEGHDYVKDNLNFEIVHAKTLAAMLPLLQETT